MRARRREINIFNMSLLDILCGALGAFCFMMLVAFPYYKPSANAAKVREEQEKTDELLKDIEKLKERMADPEAAAALEELLRQLEAQIKALQGQVNQLTAENQQLTADNTELDRKLRLKTPFMVVVSAREMNQDLDVYLKDDIKSPKFENPPFDPTVPHHSIYWPGDLNAYVPNHGISIWVVAESPINIHYKIYAKLASEPSLRKTSVVSGGVFGASYNLELPELTLTPERFWSLVGTLTTDAEAKLTFKEATAAEREAEWRTLSKSAPPSRATPTAAPSKKMTDERRALIDQMRKEELKKSPSPTPTP